jgi:hypothetical protein
MDGNFLPSLGSLSWSKFLRDTRLNEGQNIRGDLFQPVLSTKLGLRTTKIQRNLGKSTQSERPKAILVACVGNTVLFIFRTSRVTLRCYRVTYLAILACLLIPQISHWSPLRGIKKAKTLMDDVQVLAATYRSLRNSGLSR